MTNLEADARDVMEQIQMAESRHMQLGALVSYQLQHPDRKKYLLSLARSVRNKSQEQFLDI